MKVLKITFNYLKRFLERLDYWRNEFLYFFIKPYWPKRILPNYITYIRVVIAIALFTLIFFFKIEDKALIVSLFSVGLLTDLIDGPVARGLGNVTEYGAMLDSTADRILLLPIAIYSLFKPHKWLLLVLLIMEIFNAMVSLFYKSKEIYLESNIFGKTKMVVMSVVFVVILYVWPYSPPDFFIYLLWLTIPCTLLSMVNRLAELYPEKFKIS